MRVSSFLLPGPLTITLVQELVFSTFNIAGTREQVGNFVRDDFPFDWLRMMVEQLKRIRPYYYGDYYPLSPCSTRADCIAEAGKESSAAVEWAAWQFNRPEQRDGIVQAFRRNRCEAEPKVFWLKGLIQTRSTRSRISMSKVR
jgi:hypothetical protein